MTRTTHERVPHSFSAPPLERTMQLNTNEAVGPPPPYSSRPPSMQSSSHNSSFSTSSGSQIYIDSPGSVPDFPLTGDESDALPTSNECLQHLKLLAAFATLRADISQRADLWGSIDPDLRWRIYVCRAVERFTVWWERAVPSTIGGWEANVLTRHNLAERMRSLGGWFLTGDFGAEQRETIPGMPMDYGVNEMPPLDVVMVWHAYLLNPRCFLEDCFRYGKLDFWATGLPLPTLEECIDPITFSYTATSRARRHFETTTELPYDNLALPSAKSLHCSSCSLALEVPWEVFAFSKRFVWPCSSCPEIVTLDTLAKSRFLADLRSGQLFPGTILNKNGRPALENKDYNTSAHMFPNRIFALLSAEQDLGACLSEPTAGMDLVRTLITTTPSNSPAAQGIYSIGTSTNGRHATAAMLAAYADNPSPFSLRLSSAIHRLSTFTQQIQVCLPRLSLPSALQAYTNFVALHRLHPGQAIVPTLAVDLTWHTHLLAPRRYYIYSVSHTRRLLSHNVCSGVGETVLSEAWLWTARTYRKAFRKEYVRCACWYCDCTRALVGSRPLAEEEGEAEADAETDAEMDYEPTHPSLHDVLRQSGRATEIHVKLLHRTYIGLRKKGGLEIPRVLDRAMKGGPLLAIQNGEEDSEAGEWREGNGGAGRRKGKEKERGRGGVVGVGRVLGKVGGYVLWGIDT